MNKRKVYLPLSIGLMICLLTFFIPTIKASRG